MSDPVRSRRTLRWQVSLVVLLALAAGLRFAPAQLVAPVLDRLTAGQLACDRWSGTLWRGRCEALRFQGLAVGQLGWRLQGLRWWDLEARIELGWQQGRSWLQGNLTLALEARQVVARLEGLRVEADLEALQNALPYRWRQSRGLFNALDGWLSVPQLALRFGPGARLCGQGQLRLHSLRRADWPGSVGPLELQLDAACPPLRAELKDLGGTLQIRLDVELEAGSRLNLRGEIAPRPSALQPWLPVLSQLGPLGENGAYGVDLSLEWRGGT